MYALILAGGKGERLRPLTDTLPKPMVPVGGKPILAHQVEWLQAIGVTDVVFLAGYRWEVIRDHFGDGRKFGIQAHYSIEDSPLGRGGAIRKGFPLVPETDRSVMVLNGDVITSESPKALLERRAIGIIYTEVLFVPVYQGQAWCYDIAAFLARYGYRLFDYYNFTYADSGRLRWGDALFVAR